MVAMILGYKKMFPVTVHIYDIQSSRIMTKFFGMNLLEGLTASTTKSMLNSVDDLISKHNISWDYCMVIGLYTTFQQNLVPEKKMTILSLLGIHAIFYITHLQKMVMHLTKPLGLRCPIIALIYITDL